MSACSCSCSPSGWRRTRRGRRTRAVGDRICADGDGVCRRACLRRALQPSRQLGGAHAKEDGRERVRRLHRCAVRRRRDRGFRRPLRGWPRAACTGREFREDADRRVPFHVRACLGRAERRDGTRYGGQLLLRPCHRLHGARGRVRRRRHLGGCVQSGHRAGRNGDRPLRVEQHLDLLPRRLRRSRRRRDRILHRASGREGRWRYRGSEYPVSRESESTGGLIRTHARRFVPVRSMENSRRRRLHPDRILLDEESLYDSARRAYPPC